MKHTRELVYFYRYNKRRSQTNHNGLVDLGVVFDNKTNSTCYSHIKPT